MVTRPYTGPAANGQTLSNMTSVNQYTNGCSNAYTCVGGNYLNQSLSTTVLYANGSPSVSTQTQSLYNSAVGKIGAVQQWKPCRPDHVWLHLECDSNIGRRPACDAECRRSLFTDGLALAQHGWHLD